ncbi:hypothetical protein KHA76_001799 [Salmonella enterica subsp. houtenae serovar 44:z36,[z38]:-]|uniref:Uncharacterized protein n=2 Tax=Salmonella enterica TaxID=28901 RepID=A0A736IAP5_SALHO|nr:hypothetical protein [Salmonella enterica]EHM8757108.1 hypothetical protein [Salmonella enterica subsp. houtenae serovar 44:z36,[z38]:-]HAE7580901.1 hypothetical protein [Salmonella enterica subsp. houtenae serovar 44:z36[z38]:-]HCM6266695.1 hypothetical protein [Salmonella enterica subsp. houtenae serovar 44:z36,Z38:-]EGF3877522.1 hypothetical protein [Salmonella enterica]
MSKSDHKFVNTGVDEEYELKDWLYGNDFSKKQSNVDELKNIINKKVKKGKTEDNITWDELDSALENHPVWFSSLAPIGE